MEASFGLICPTEEFKAFGSFWSFRNWALRRTPRLFFRDSRSTLNRNLSLSPHPNHGKVGHLAINLSLSRNRIVHFSEKLSCACMLEWKVSVWWNRSLHPPQGRLSNRNIFHFFDIHGTMRPPLPNGIHKFHPRNASKVFFCFSKKIVYDFAFAFSISELRDKKGIRNTFWRGNCAHASFPGFGSFRVS